MGLFIVGFIILIGFVLLSVNSLRNRKLTDVLLFSILIVIAGLTIIIYAEKETLANLGLVLSIIGMMLGIIRFFLKDSDGTENL
ncbi:hypothetical protein ACFOZY_12255 [Chungangia koreensis]|uniref:Uncharacterized protein n=1 Tax=Chungangia koreensis TaxID=752657 RepID=A0ABV8X708_9LACT